MVWGHVDSEGFPKLPHPLPEQCWRPGPGGKGGGELSSSLIARKLVLLLANCCRQENWIHPPLSKARLLDLI